MANTVTEMVDTATGQWGTLTLGVPDFLEDARETINEIAEFLTSFLDIALAMLNIAKAFLIGYLDPILALVQAILDEFKAILRDLRQMGLYITGDWPLLEWPYQDLRGGFPEYERRMLARLTDHTDPTRPDLSSQTAILSFFFYLSVDISQIEKLIAFMRKLVAYFQQDYTISGPPVPAITEVRYGNNAASVFQLSDLGAFFNKGDGSPPNVAQVKWVATVPTKNSPFDPFPPLPPGGYIITVSTFRDGIPLVYDRPRTGLGKVDGQQPRESGKVLDEAGRQIVLYGGAESFILPSDLEYNAPIKDDGTLEDNKMRVYGQTPAGDPIPLEDLKGTVGGDTVYYFQRSFNVEVPAVERWIDEGLTYLLQSEEMPRYASVSKDSKGEVTIEDAGPASTVFVRIASTTRSIADGTNPFRYDFSKLLPLKDDSSVEPRVTTESPDAAFSDVSPFSEPRQAVFPTVNTQKYLQSVEAALALLVLTRPDLTPVDTLEGVLSKEQVASIKSNQLIVPGLALKRSGLEGLKHLVGFIYEDYAAALRAVGESPTKMRDHVRSRIRAVAHDLYSKTGPLPDAEASVVAATKHLREVKWKDIFGAQHPDKTELLSQKLQEATILQSLDTDDEQAGGFLNSGVALNPYCMGVDEEVVDKMFFADGLVTDRLPQMQEGVVGGEDSDFTARMTVGADEATAFLRDLPPSLRMFYETSIQKDGSIVVPEEERGALEDIVAKRQIVGSADLSPVFYVNRSSLEDVRQNTTASSVSGRVYYCRGLLTGYRDGQLLQEAALALSVAGAALNRSPDDGEWIAIRLLDQYPALEDVLTQFVNWLEAIAKTAQSAVDAIKKYIEFVEARIIGIQQLIRRINALIQSLLGYTFQIPKCSALMLLSNGTGGVVSDLTTAKNKPPDSPLAFGAGIAVVIPVGPPLVLAIIKTLMGVSDGEATGYLSEEGQTPPVIGIEGFPASTPVPPDPEPDVL